MTTLLLFFLFGLLTLIAGAELLVRGASRLAAAVGISPLVIGLTIVALGTASPEIAVSLQAAANGQGDLTFGNVLGSNIFNILFILGLTAVITPVVIAEQLIRKDAPILFGISMLTYVLAFNGRLSWVDGLILISGMIIYVIFALRQSRGESAEVKKEYAAEFGQKEPSTAKNTITNAVFVVLGLGLLLVGSNWLVDSAVEIAKFLGISELVIGLTIVAVGTSLPEVATSLMAALKGESDIAVGNAVGSNIFNLLGVLGVGALAGSGGIPVAGRVLAFDLPVMLFVALVTLPVFYIDNRISRLEGGLLLTYYALYITLTIMSAAESSLLTAALAFTALFAFVTFVVLIVNTARSMRSKRINH
jgi:cation:H+ antiporter